MNKFRVGNWLVGEVRLRAAILAGVFLAGGGGLVLGCSGSVDPSEATSSVQQPAVTSSLSLLVPTGSSPQQMLISTNGRLQLDDRTTTGKVGLLGLVGNYGSSGSELGSQAVVNGNVDSS